MDQTQALQEAVTSIKTVRSQTSTPGRLRVRIIEADRWGSSAYYPASVLKRDASVFKAGTHAYFDHPTVTEAIDRPERSVRDLAGRLATDARFEGDGLYAEMEVFPQYREVIESMADAIGLSIRASGTVEDGEMEGRSGPILTAFTEGISVDFVTAAGAGGKIVELLESARAASRAAKGAALREGRNVGHYMESRIHHHFTGIADGMFGEGKLTREERIGLSKGIGDGLDAFTKRVQEDHPQLYERDIYDGPPGENGSQVAESVRRRLREGHGLTANELSSALRDAVF
jgi:hypothetical protein